MSEPDRYVRTNPWQTGLWVLWVIATIVGWFVGIVAAFFLTYAVVIPVYHKETNLIAGICLGTVVSLSQKIAVHRWMALTQSWVWGAMVGIGIPFVAAALWPGIPARWELPGVAIGGAICGLLQIPALRPHASRLYWWVFASMVTWTLGWCILRYGGLPGFLAGVGLGGAVHGALTGGVLMLLWKPTERPGGDDGSSDLGGWERVENEPLCDPVAEERKRKAQPLHEAVRQGDLNVAKRCIEEGADVNTLIGHDSALDVAIEAGRLDMVRLLVANGAKIEAGFFGKSDSWARQLGHDEIADFLHGELAKRGHGREVEEIVCEAGTCHNGTNMGGSVPFQRRIGEPVEEVEREKRPVAKTHDQREETDMQLKLMREKILGTPLVKALPEAMRQRFAMILLWVSESRDVSRREKLFVQGEKDTGTGCVILEGMVQVRTEDNAGAPKHIDAPDVLGEVQLFTPQGQRTATVEVVVGGTILLFAWKDLGAAAQDLYSDEEMAALKRVIAESAWRREENLFEKTKN